MLQHRPDGPLLSCNWGSLAENRLYMSRHRITPQCKFIYFVDIVMESNRLYICAKTEGFLPGDLPGADTGGRGFRSRS